MTRIFPPSSRRNVDGRRVLSTENGIKVLERLAVSEKTSLVIERQPDGKIHTAPPRVTSATRPSMTDSVTRDAAEIQNDLAIPDTRDAERARRMRARRRVGMVVRRIELQREWLDALEQRGYLDPFQRGNRAHERKAIERFLAESLARPR